MGRRRAHAPLQVLINNRLVGRLEKEANGAIGFRYDETWLDWAPAFPVSLSLPLRPTPYRGAPVAAVFDNLLPDNPDVRRIIAERTGAASLDAYGLLEQIGRDCVGALQFLPEGMVLDAAAPATGTSISDAEIESILANLARAPLGLDQEQAFRISVAGAQEKIALLFQDGQWKRPTGTTATTHILKPQLGQIPTAFGTIDLSNSVENEHYCLKLIEAFGLPVAQTQIVRFGDRTVLVVERFDRAWRGVQLLRLPQEDFCQVLSIAPSQKYQNQHGPSAVDILRRLKASETPLEDQAAFFKSQVLFWLIGATDGHAKNFSVFLKTGGRFAMTPFYDILSAQPAFDAKAIAHRTYKLAMSAGDNRHYKILDVHGRHFVETAREAGLRPRLVRAVFDEIIALADKAGERALAQMPVGFHEGIHTSLTRAIQQRLPRLASALAEL
ncbi:type II toxin-antitoxin system HipA family toxin [Caulobacter sp.]|uniref:type II toxin-antitoxin system HipA family toxin n=1 Tax=Caulobacter sp. TaxID=78 RepID=UPI001B1325F4|nr:type II toxin-antitoxin system HipA family toxin [Caulobacter sp.]MBO9547128.1 type II toxin-antitoxin system HipA family toxin [Caulobacter sp.]